MAKPNGQANWMHDKCSIAGSGPDSKPELANTGPVSRRTFVRKRLRPCARWRICSVRIGREALGLSAAGIHRDAGGSRVFGGVGFGFGLGGHFGNRSVAEEPGHFRFDCRGPRPVALLVRVFEIRH